MKDIGNRNLHPSYFQLPFIDFEKCMKNKGFKGNFKAAYKKGGGVIEETKVKKTKKEGD